MTTSVDGQVTVRQIAKTFASGRSAEKYFYSIMSDCGLPSGKVIHNDILVYRVSRIFLKNIHFWPHVKNPNCVY